MFMVAITQITHKSFLVQNRIGSSLLALLAASSAVGVSGGSASGLILHCTYNTIYYNTIDRAWRAYMLQLPSSFLVSCDPVCDMVSLLYQIIRIHLLIISK